MARISRDFSFFSFIWRLVAALVLVLATYNPSDFSYYDWVMGNLAAEDAESSNIPAKVVVGMVLLIGWAMLLIATRSSLGTLGVGLGIAFMAAVVWFLINQGWLDPAKGDTLQWVILVCLGLLLAMGLSGSHIWRRLTGQVDITDEEP